MKCRIADFNLKVDNVFLKIENLCKQYCIPDNEICEISFSMTTENIEAEKIDGSNSIGYLEYVSLCRKLSEALPMKGAFLLHSACFDVNGSGVAFSAHSGTGKTTHMLLWQKLLGDRLTVVNGDKPIVRFFENEPETPYAYGTPWCGKENLGCNMRTPLKHICFIERAEQNSCEPMEKGDAVNLIFDQVYMPKNPEAMMQTLQLIDRLLSCCRLWKIKCNMEPQAAEVSFGAIFGKEPAASKI